MVPDLGLEAGGARGLEIRQLGRVLANITGHLTASRPGARTCQFSLCVCPALLKAQTKPLSILDCAS